MAAPLALLPLVGGLVKLKQKEALIALYESTDGANWALAPHHPMWNSTPPELWPPGGNRGWDVQGDFDPCSENTTFGKAWHGVSCDDPCIERDGPACRHGEIVALELEWNNLVGTIPSMVYDRFTQMAVLDLKHNEVSGTLPTEVGKLRMLSLLYLGKNSLSGTIPTEIRTVGSHVSAPSTMHHSDDMDCNVPIVDPRPGAWWSSPLPCTYTGSPQVGPEILDLSHNNFNGTIPTVMGDLYNLRAIDVSDNHRLGGKCCTEEYSWYERDFYEYTTAIPTELGSLMKLQGLLMHNSHFLRYLPTELGRLRSLTWWEAAGNGSWMSNQISGTVPTELGKLSVVQRVATHDNQLSGSIPPQIANMSALRHIQLQDNKLSGSIPDAWGGMTRLRHWDSFANKLTGDLPASVWELKELEEFYIQNEHTDVIRQHYCRQRITNSANGRKHNWAGLGSDYWVWKHVSMCANPLDVAGAFDRLSGDV